MNYEYFMYIYLTYDLDNGFQLSFLYVIIIISILSGILIITTKNPIVSVLYLIVLFSCVSCYLIMLGMKYLGLSYLLVYVGAVSILFLFILMLINIRVSELISDTSNSIPISILSLIGIFVPISNILPGKSNVLENKESVYYVSSSN
ncbi:MAG: NADH-quinone oxidoreductase subunit J [Rickettsiales bacterium]|nr:MAG: NADH-quinone oxidoreductase subunit J [Rickettsiales bacterium]